MHRLHRVIAALMLVVFIPVAVMAGPMRVCVSKEGHQAVELAHTPHGPADFVELATAVDDDLVVNQSQLPGCVDRDLITALGTGIAVKADIKAAGLDDDPGFGNATLVAPVIAHQLTSPAAKRLAVFGRLTDQDPQLAAIETVILLI